MNKYSEPKSGFRKPAKGFTLIELMVSVIIISISVISIYQAFIGCMDGKVAAENYNRCTVLALEQIQKFEEESTGSGGTEQLSENNRLFEWTIERKDLTGNAYDAYPSLKAIILNMKWQGPGEHRKGQMTWTYYTIPRQE
ncbi:MAG: prepilin-type N-terminal cleavage/methylation domain-containing protein [Candidatus Brocadiia bacterium]